MNEEKILQLWEKGFSKYKVARIYRQLYNEQVKLARLEYKDKYKGRLISNYEALAIVEASILKQVKKMRK
ncbi:MAG: hypothetical protein ACLS95_04130 [Clostridia bacterium]